MSERATQASRLQNVRPRSASGFRGVTWVAKSGRWQARVRMGAADHYLGCFDSAEEAAVVAQFRAKHMPGAIEFLGHDRRNSNQSGQPVWEVGWPHNPKERDLQ